MREKKILMLIIAIMLLASNIMVYAGGTYYDGNDTSIGTEFEGSIDDHVDPDELRYVKDESPGDGTLAMGNGYSIKLDYNSDKTNVTWILNRPTDPDFEIRIDRINVKASNGYMSYPEGLDDGSNILWSVLKDCKGVDSIETSIEVACIECSDRCGYYEISHVTVVYEFTEIEKFGRIKVCKVVSGRDIDSTAFPYIMEGRTLTGSGFVSEEDCIVINDVPLGEYYFEETVLKGYIGIVTTGTVIITEGALLGVMTFENEKEMPPEPGELKVDKYVYGEGALSTDEFLIRVKNLAGETITGGAISQEQGKSFMLPPGEYMVEETGYAGYTPRYLTISAIVESEATTTVAFHNDKNQEPPEPGELKVDKYVYGEGALSTDEFLIRVKNLAGETITGGAISQEQGKSFMLPPGEYMVEETGYAGYTPRYLTISAIVESEATTTVAFHNDKNQEPPEPGELKVDKYVYGEGALSTDEFLIRVKNLAGETITGGAISQEQGKSFMLPPGEYMVEETGYAGYTPRYLTVSAIVESESTTTVAFHNDKNQEPPGPSYVYVYKEFSEGTDPVTMPFDFRIATDETLTGEAIVVESSVANGTPEGPFELEPGTYYLGERPSEGWELVPVQMFELGEEETKHLTLTNTAIEELVCNLEIEKTVDDDYVKRNVDVTYTVELFNSGDYMLYIDFWDSDGEDINVTESGIYLEPGATTTRAFTTSYGSTGKYENVATATYYKADEYCYNDLLTVQSEDNGCYLEECGTVTDSAVVTVYKPDSDRYRMKITKEADDDEYEVGDIITYTITVENTGNKTLTDIEVTDPMLEFEEIIDRLPHSGDDSVEFEVIYRATEEGVIDNTAYAKDDRAPDVEDDETVVVKDDTPRDSPKPGLSIVKTIAGDKQAGFETGEQIWFNLVVTNTGETDLENIEIRDPFGGYFTEYVRTIPELDKGDSITIQDVYMIVPEDAVDFDNVATATTGDLTASDLEQVILAERKFVDAEEETPLALPDAGVSPIFMFYGLAALVSGLGMTIRKRR